MDTPLGDVRSSFLDLLHSIVIFSDELRGKTIVGKVVFCKYVQSLGSDDAKLDGAIDQVVRNHGIANLLLFHESIVACLI